MPLLIPHSKILQNLIVLNNIHIHLLRNNDDLTEENICGLCTQQVSTKEEMVSCISPRCGAISHIACLAQHYRHTTRDKNKLDYLIPVDGTCPVCDFHCLWGDIVKKKKGFFENLPFKAVSSDEDEFDADF